ncbi:MAG: hypothetical protein P8M07_00280, partial [Flavobacteriales bacterium]|nr:hypothetical protein [Flavobacteriales bacterium]
LAALISYTAVAQKKELKAAQKLVDASLYQKALVALNEMQPLIENAIWHGLRHLPQGVPAVLGLSIHEVRDGLIEIQIQDNGLPEDFTDTPDAISVPAPAHPGRDAKEARRHASDIIRQRLQLLDNLGDCRLNIASTHAGTTSRLTLPTRHV